MRGFDFTGECLRLVGGDAFHHCIIFVSLKVSRSEKIVLRVCGRLDLSHPFLGCALEVLTPDLISVVFEFAQPGYQLVDRHRPMHP
jgi:hypothetical protein